MFIIPNRLVAIFISPKKHLDNKLQPLTLLEKSGRVFFYFRIENLMYKKKHAIERPFLFT